MRYQGTTSASNWVDMWMDKFSAELAARELPAAEVTWYRDVVRRYLTENGGNPREIDTLKLKKFVASQKTDAALPLRIFYEKVAWSAKHMEALEKPKKKEKKLPRG